MHNKSSDNISPGSPAIHPDLARLIELALGTATSTLAKQDTFVPGFFAIDRAGKYQLGAAGLSGSEGSNLLVIGLRQKAESEGLRAAAIYRDVRVRPAGASNDVDAVQIIAELASGEAVHLFQVYRRSASGEVALGESETVPAPSAIFGEPSPELKAHLDERRRGGSGRDADRVTRAASGDDRGRALKSAIDHDLVRLVNIALHTAKRKLAANGAFLPGAIAVRESGKYDASEGALGGADGWNLVTTVLRQKVAAEHLRAAALYRDVRMLSRGAPEDVDAIHVVAELSSGAAVHAFQSYLRNDGGKLSYGTLEMEPAPSVIFAASSRDGTQSKRWWEFWN